MKKKNLYLALIILSFALIYALATGIYFTGSYRAATYDLNVDAFSEGYFYLLNTIGILAISLYMKKNYTRFRMILAYSVSLLVAVVSALILFLPLSTSAFICALIFVYIAIGCTQGVYVFVLTKTVPKSKRCFVLGIGASIAVIVNSLLSLIKGGLFVQSISAVIVYFGIAVMTCFGFAFALTKLSDSEDTNEMVESAESATPSIWNTKVFLTSCFFILFSWLIQSLAFYFPFNSSLVLGLSNEAVRITNVLGLLIGGYINSHDKKTGSLSCLIILATPMLYIILQNQAGATLLVFLLSYFLTGILSIYRIGIIADMSDSVNSKGESMTYLCAFGLLFGRLGEGLGGLMGIRFKDNLLLLLTLTCFALTIAVAFFISHYMKLYTPVPLIVQNHEDKMNAFKIKYNLSNREMDVLEYLLDNNSNAEIADKLYVSENTVRFHVSNILKKTGCKSRKEISSLFYGS